MSSALLGRKLLMDSSSPVPSTPINGVSLQGKWSFPCTPDDCVRKKLFEQEPAVEDEDNNDSELKRWSSSSEYFSQSNIDASCLSGESPTNLFDENSPAKPEMQQVRCSNFKNSNSLQGHVV